MTIAEVMLAVLASALSALAVMTVFSSISMKPRLLSPGQFEGEKETMLAARREAMERSSHFETLLVALGSFELGVLAYVGSVMIQKPLRDIQDYVANRPLFFSLVCVLF